MTPESRGTVRLASADPAAKPLIDHRYLADPDGHDRRVLVDAVRVARDMARQPSLRDLLGDEVTPGTAVTTESGIVSFVDSTCEHYYHPVGTCKMGPTSDPTAVVDPRGKVHGLEGLYVADCSIMPVIPRANTNFPAVMVGERIAALLRRL
jgi:choline dehydrogenase-like flavoprotein